MKFATAFKIMRKFGNLSQAELAEFVNVNPSTIARIESGKRNCTIRLLEKCCECCGLTKSEFFWLEELHDSDALQFAKAIVSVLGGGDDTTAIHS